MSEPVEELMLRWEAARQEGRTVALEELCADCPQLAEELRQRIDSVVAMEDVLGVMRNGPERTEPMLPAALSARPEPLPTIPGYEIVRVLDQGGMGVVYLARQIALGRVVAVKMISGGRHGPTFLARFQAEAAAAARLQHPNFVQAFEVGQVEGRPFFAMEYVDGGSLAERLARARPDPRDAAELARTLALAMQAAHERGVVHRDLKPANVMLTADGVPKIADFGLAKRLDDEAGHAHTRTGEVLGTPSYMAPEQAEGRKDQIGPATDVYALGALFYEMLSGRPPFQGESVLDTLRLIAHKEPLAPSEFAPAVPRDLDAVCLKCLEKAPERRYPTARALAEDLRRYLDGEPVQARRAGPLRRTWKLVRRHPQAVALTGALVALSLLLLVPLFDSYRAQQQLRAKAEEQAPLVRDILERNCYECHGRNPRKMEKNLNVLDHDFLVNTNRDRPLVVPGAPAESRLLQRIADGSMPPEKDEKRLPRLSDVELTILNDWILGGAAPLPPPDPQHPAPTAVPFSKSAAEAKAIFVKHCYECHSGKEPEGGIKILHHRLLVAVRKVVVPYRPDESELVQLIESKDDPRMPPAPKEGEPDRRLPDDEIATVRRWIEEGAPPFPRTD